MCVFTLDEGAWVVALRVAFATLVAVVHGAEDVGLAVLMCLLILNGTALVDSFHSIVGILEVLAVACFVAEAPEDDGGVILLYLYVVLVALYMGFMVDGVLGESAVAIAHSVALDIGFGNYIDTVLIAKVIPTGIIGVVAGAHGVHVQLLHDFDVLNHAFHADEVTAVGVQFVAVGTFDEDGLTVDEDLSVLDFDTAETNALADGFECVAFFVLQGEGGGIEVRNLSRPRFDGGNGQGECRGLRAEGSLSAAGCATGRVG